MCIYRFICRSNISSWAWHESKHYTKLHFTIIVLKPTIYESFKS